MLRRARARELSRSRWPSRFAPRSRLDRGQRAGLGGAREGGRSVDIPDEPSDDRGQIGRFPVAVDKGLGKADIAGQGALPEEFLPSHAEGRRLRDPKGRMSQRDEFRRLRGGRRAAQGRRFHRPAAGFAGGRISFRKGLRSTAARKRGSAPSHPRHHGAKADFRSAQARRSCGGLGAEFGRGIGGFGVHAASWDRAGVRVEWGRRTSR